MQLGVTSEVVRSHLEILDRGTSETYVNRSSHCCCLNGALVGCAPVIFLPLREDQLGVGICIYELGDECAGLQVADRLAVVEKLIPLLFPEGLALAFELGEKGLTPEISV